MSSFETAEVVYSAQKQKLMPLTYWPTKGDTIVYI